MAGCEPDTNPFPGDNTVIHVGYAYALLTSKIVFDRETLAYLDFLYHVARYGAVIRDSQQSPTSPEKRGHEAIE